MGLGAPKKRTKLSQDPNNTTWSKSTVGFGHKILSKQGWKPGDFLGAEDAEHSDHYTAANASHIKVFLREENLGLGAKIGKNNAETFGLSLFSGVLGRLNGKTDGEIEKQQNSLRDAELRLYQAQKFGCMNFVHGGLLVGDKIEPASNDSGHSSKTKTQPKKIKSSGNPSGDVEASVGLKEKAKRRHGEIGTTVAPNNSEEHLEDEKTGTVVTPSDQSSSEETSNSNKRSQRWKRSKRSKGGLAAETPTFRSPTRSDREESKAERRARKADRRRRKEEKRKQRAEHKVEEATSSREATDSAAERNVAFAGNRHAVRHRYIQHKRQAVANSQAMKEIFMLNAAA